MRTEHRAIVGDARSMDAVGDDAIELVVTSPPYPMIEMWDDTFRELDPAVRDRLDAGDGEAAFDLMHEALAPVWDELERVLVEGGIACINVGDATRKLEDTFQLYPNHARVAEAFRERGFTELPGVLWRKPTNKASKFMGSGMLPPNAYVTLEHEHILVFRNGGAPRRFDPNADRRYESAYFWEERNEWFSDVWTGITGETQSLADGEARERSGAFPLEIPYRLVNMYSVYGDTVLDPFWGTGTTSTAAMLAARNSVGYELEPEFVEGFADRIADVPAHSRERCRTRIDRHFETVAERRAAGDPPEYTAETYGFPVVTKQERGIEFYAVEEVHDREDRYVVEHARFDPDDAPVPRRGEEPSADVDDRNG